VAGRDGIDNLRGLIVDSSIIFKCVMVLDINLSELGYVSWPVLSNSVLVTYLVN